MIATAHAISATLNPKLSYGLLDDFAPIIPVGTSPHVLLINPRVQANSVKELIQLAKNQPSTLNVASSGNGTPGHLVADFFQKMAGIELVHVPYRGGSPAGVDLMGGQVQLFFDNVASALSHVSSAKARAVAVTSTRRSPVLPQIPTLTESGLDGFDITSWFGIVAPKVSLRGQSRRFPGAPRYAITLRPCLQPRTNFVGSL